ncbi:MAG: PD-(D/E)XK nuclease family protein [Candidatus Woesearchaeota archaeon]
MPRVESPSSISSYKQCPRKYYYQYIEQLETKPNIHQVRGNIAHSVLENFFDQDVSRLTLDSFELGLMEIMQDLLLKEWNNADAKLKALGLTPAQRQFYFEDTLLMLLNWLNHFVRKVYTIEGSFPERFAKLTPIREELIKSDALQAKGIIDAIENYDGQVRIMDYKTSSHSNEEEYRLQLAIYTLLYNEKHGRLPDKAGIYFLKDRPKFIDVDESLLELARKEISLIHNLTKTTNINDYPRKPGRLCKWSTGQCDFFDICKPFEKQTEESFVGEADLIRKAE